MLLSVGRPHRDARMLVGGRQGPGKVAKINRSSRSITYLIKSVLTESTEKAAFRWSQKTGMIRLSQPQDK